MITNVRASTKAIYTGAYNSDLNLTFDESMPWRVKSIDGLGPVKADINSIATASDPGATFLSARDGTRNIVINVELKRLYGVNPVVGGDPYPTVSEMRQALNKVFIPKSHVYLELQTDDMGLMRIEGYVESNEPSIFTKEPTVSISIICTDPYFRKGAAPEYTVLSLAMAGHSFEVWNDSDVPVGFVLDYDVKAANSYWLLQMLPTDMFKDVGLSGLSLKIDDHVKISTVPGDRFINWTSSASTNSALAWFSGSLVSMQLAPGRNYFRTNQYFNMKNTTLSYERLYGGL